MFIETSKHHRDSSFRLKIDVILDKGLIEKMPDVQVILRISVDSQYFLCHDSWNAGIRGGDGSRQHHECKINSFLLAHSLVLDSFKTKSEAQLDLFKELFLCKITKPMEWKRASIWKKEEKRNWKTYKLIQNGNYFFISLQIFLLSFLCFSCFPLKDARKMFSPPELWEVRKRKQIL